MTAIAKIERKTAQAELTVAACREAITNAVTQDLDAKRIGDKVNALAEAEGAFYAWRFLARYVSNGQAVRSAIAELLCQPSEDTWSGRGNDVQRSRLDGIRSVANSALYLED